MAWLAPLLQSKVTGAVAADTSSSMEPSAKPLQLTICKDELATTGAALGTNTESTTTQPLVWVIVTVAQPSETERLVFPFIPFSHKN